MPVTDGDKISRTMLSDSVKGNAMQSACQLSIAAGSRDSNAQAVNRLGSRADNEGSPRQSFSGAARGATVDSADAMADRDRSHAERKGLGVGAAHHAGDSVLLGQGPVLAEVQGGSVPEHAARGQEARRTGRRVRLQGAVQGAWQSGEEVVVLSTDGCYGRRYGQACYCSLGLLWAPRSSSPKER
jgi:hypothetical protein